MGAGGPGDCNSSDVGAMNCALAFWKKYQVLLITEPFLRFHTKPCSFKYGILEDENVFQKSANKVMGTLD